MTLVCALSLAVLVVVVVLEFKALYFLSFICEDVSSCSLTRLANKKRASPYLKCEFYMKDRGDPRT